MKIFTHLEIRKNRSCKTGYHRCEKLFEKKPINTTMNVPGKIIVSDFSGIVVIYNRKMITTIQLNV